MQWTGEGRFPDGAADVARSRRPWTRAWAELTAAERPAPAVAHLDRHRRRRATCGQACRSTRWPSAAVGTALRAAAAFGQQRGAAAASK